MNVILRGLHPTTRKSLLRAARNNARRRMGGDSELHGAKHWERVRINGLLLAEKTGASAMCVELFAMFHDCARDNDGIDPGHGLRGAMEGNRILHDHGLRLPKALEHDLFQACEHHSEGLTSDNVNIGTCWDADRLDLFRIGVYPNPAYLSTSAAKDESFIAAAVARTRMAA